MCVDMMFVFNDVDELMVTVAGDIDFAGAIIVLKAGTHTNKSIINLLNINLARDVFDRSHCSVTICFN